MDVVCHPTDFHSERKARLLLRVFKRPLIAPISAWITAVSLPASPRAPRAAGSQRTGCFISDSILRRATSQRTQLYFVAFHTDAARGGARRDEPLLVGEASRSRAAKSRHFDLDATSLGTPKHFQKWISDLGFSLCFPFPCQAERSEAQETLILT